MPPIFLLESRINWSFFSLCFLIVNRISSEKSFAIIIFDSPFSCFQFSFQDFLLEFRAYNAFHVYQIFLHLYWHLNFNYYNLKCLF